MNSSSKKSDLARRPVSFLVGWGLPAGFIILTNFLHDFFSIEAIVLVIATMFAWMGAACVVNARRCGRLHCMLAGPVLLLGAAATLLVGFQLISLGQDGLTYVVWATAILAGLTFVPEWVFGAYVKK